MFEKVLCLWAWGSPETPMQRLGAFLMMLVSVFASAITLGVVSQALDKTWTVSGVSASVFGVGMMSLVLPTGLAHGLAAAFPLIFDRWKHKRNMRLGYYVMLQLDGLKFFYSLLGWAGSIGLVALIAYLIEF